MASILQPCISPFAQLWRVSEGFETTGPLGSDLPRRVLEAKRPNRKRNIHFLEAVCRCPDEARILAYIIAINFPERVGTQTMHSNVQPASYSGAVFEAVCEELQFFPFDSRKDIEREIDRLTFALQLEPGASHIRCRMDSLNEKLDPSRRRLDSSVFREECWRQLRKLPRYFSIFCHVADPNTEWVVPFFRDFEDALERIIEIREGLLNSLVPETGALLAVRDAIQSARRHGHMVWVSGKERAGKTTAARLCALADPGGVRLVELVAEENDRGFYFSICQQLGGDPAPNATEFDLKELAFRICSTRDQVIVFDEAHTIFGCQPLATARRAEWFRTRLLNSGIPVVLIFTGDGFLRRMQELCKSTTWNSRQFDGRLGASFAAPEASERELRGITKFYLHGASASAVDATLAAAVVSEHRIPTIVRIAIESSAAQVPDLPDPVGDSKPQQVDAQTATKLTRCYAEIVVAHRVLSRAPTIYGAARFCTFRTAAKHNLWTVRRAIKHILSSYREMSDAAKVPS